MEIDREILGCSGQPAVRVIYGPNQTSCNLSPAIQHSRSIGETADRWRDGVGVDGGWVWGGWWVVGGRYNANFAIPCPLTPERCQAMIDEMSVNAEVAVIFLTWFVFLFFPTLVLFTLATEHMSRQHAASTDRTSCLVLSPSAGQSSGVVVMYGGLLLMCIGERG